jgi:hypothetical protein
MTTNEQRQLGRAKNAILAFFERRISVPKIYIDANWDSHPIDVLAIDRDGVGDVHAVLLLPTNLNRNSQSGVVILADEDVRELIGEVNQLIARFQEIPAQYKYIAAVDVSGRGGAPLLGVPHPSLDRSYAPDGIGRIGFLSIEFRSDGDAEAKVTFKPERFRAKIAKLADDYIQQHEPDWQVRA